MTILNNNRHSTGGGPSKQPIEDANIEKVISLIRTNVEGFNNIYDSDATLLDDNENTSNEQITMCLPGSASLDLDKENNMNEVPINGDWSTYTPALLQTPRPKILRENYDYTIVEEIEAEEGKSTGSDPKSDPKSDTPKRASTSVIEDIPPLNSSVTKINSSVTKTTRHFNNRRRPMLRESEAVALATKKIETLQSTVEQSKQQHEIAMRCLLLQEEQEKEKLKQEKSKSKLEEEKLEQEIIKKKILMVQLENADKKKYSSNSF